MKLLVGLTGYARSGKDTAAAYLAEIFQMDHRAFAENLKRITAILADEPVANFHDDVLKEQLCPALGMTRRKAMQVVGTEMVRERFGPDIWHTNLLNSWRAQGCGPTVISDVRFDNEARAVRNAGGVIVRIVRPGAGLGGEAANHVSEQGVSEHLVDFTIVNDGSHAELYIKLHELMAALGVD